MLFSGAWLLGTRGNRCVKWGRGKRASDDRHFQGGTTTLASPVVAPVDKGRGKRG